MFFDLTKEIILSPKATKRYLKIRAFLYLLAFALTILIIFLILFPTQTFNYSFIFPATNKGNALNPRNENSEIMKTGEIAEKEAIFFDSSVTGQFSRVVFNFKASKDSERITNTEISFKKSYRAALFPEGLPFGFREGSLLKNGNNFFIVSENRIRQFQDEKILSTLGFSKDAFREISLEDMKYNEVGEKIFDDSAYPTSSLFKIENEYYQLTDDKKLAKFISARAYLSEWNDIQAVLKNKDFFSIYPQSEKILGFANGSILSYGESAFIASREKIYPIGSPEIFLGQGFDWNDLIPVSGDEISLYEKEKMFNFSSAHPDGIVFFTTDTEEYYIINQDEKHKLPTEKIAFSYLKKKPIQILAKSLMASGQCKLEKNIGRNYSCEIPLEDSAFFPGQYYEFNLLSDDKIRLDNLNVSFKRNATKDNLKLSILGMIQRIKAHFGLKSSP